ncbi:hypothetical protein DQ04_02021070 [Trypanosoma grayi]|uniref:hypothetical protein n=1 Tax=Trypanosoma grayi TaxID=71804 RepID=UPI0004F42657|nr:hypothetical protein DQ04_02021070 [Trypanosoma grayi]KEG12081.1 hypothetical protein DQ04_02021070 [Trypanosoma grayi]
MLRRKLLSSCRVFSQPLLDARRSVIAEDPLEREREKELRQRVIQRYRGVNLPELTDFRYGHFAAQEGATTSAASQAYATVNNGFPMGGAGSSGRQGVDWLMLFTGFALVYVSSKFMLQRFSFGDIDNINMPLWSASLETQAKYLLFSIQYDVRTREQIRQAYHNVRQTNPFTDFFQWLRVQHPEYGHGVLYNYENAVGTLVSILSSGSSDSLMTLARSVQNALRKQGGSPAQRIDDFVTDLGALAGMRRVQGNTFSTGYVNSPPPPPSVQVYGTEPVTILNALDATPSKEHSSVPFQ